MCLLFAWCIKKIIHADVRLLGPNNKRRSVMVLCGAGRPMLCITMSAMRISSPQMPVGAQTIHSDVDHTEPRKIYYNRSVWSEHIPNENTTINQQHELYIKCKVICIFYIRFLCVCVSLPAERCRGWRLHIMEYGQISDDAHEEVTQR